MAGQDPFVAPAPPPTADHLTLRDLLSGFVFLSPTKVPPAIDEPVTSPPALPGRYVLLCNVRPHYKGVFEGQPFSMCATLRVVL